MIKLIADDRCTRCNVCIHACPNDVFDPVPGQAPVIARPDDCHTCFLCELYCPVDAIYVAPLEAPGAAPAISWGSYARASGWYKGRPQIEEARSAS